MFLRDLALKSQTCKNLRKWYKESGICASCGQEWAEPGHTLCKGCNAKMAAYHAASREHRIEAARERRAKRIAEGICTECGKAPATEGMRMCPICREKRNDSTRKYKIKKKIKKQNEKERLEAIERGRKKWGR